jgi:hypothetical protein
LESFVSIVRADIARVVAEAGRVADGAAQSAELLTLSSRGDGESKREHHEAAGARVADEDVELVLRQSVNDPEASPADVRLRLLQQLNSRMMALEIALLKVVGGETEADVGAPLSAPTVSRTGPYLKLLARLLQLHAKSRLLAPPSVPYTQQQAAVRLAAAASSADAELEAVREELEQLETELGAADDRDNASTSLAARLRWVREQGIAFLQREADDLRASRREITRLLEHAEKQLQEAKAAHLEALRRAQIELTEEQQRAATAEARALAAEERARASASASAAEAARAREELAARSEKLAAELVAERKRVASLQQNSQEAESRLRQAEEMHSEELDRLARSLEERRDGDHEAAANYQAEATRLRAQLTESEAQRRAEAERATRDVELLRAQVAQLEAEGRRAREALAATKSTVPADAAVILERTLGAHDRIETFWKASLAQTQSELALARAEVRSLQAARERDAASYATQQRQWEEALRRVQIAAKGPGEQSLATSNSFEAALREEMASMRATFEEKLAHSKSELARVTAELRAEVRRQQERFAVDRRDAAIA